jgi:hypothetical protein
MDCRECLGQGDEDCAIGHDAQRSCTNMVYEVLENYTGGEINNFGRDHKSIVKGIQKDEIQISIYYRNAGK